jgi:hypothetical protein
MIRNFLEVPWLEKGWKTLLYIMGGQLFIARGPHWKQNYQWGQYKYHMDLIEMTFERKWAFSIPFSEKKHFKRLFQSTINLKICSRAKFMCLAGRILPAGRTLPRPDLYTLCWYFCVRSLKYSFFRTFSISVSCNEETALYLGLTIICKFSK